MKKNMTAVVLLLVLEAGCSSTPQEGAAEPEMDRPRKVSRQDCSRPFNTGGYNLLCEKITEAERRAMAEEEERRARARREAEERAARERLERERAEQLAREEAARKQREAEEARLAALRAAEEARLAAERRRAEEEAARKAQEERERQEKAEAEARARREAAERECRRLAQERSEGRALLENFVAKYGEAGEFKEIAGQISAFLDKTRQAKPCP
jgi:hypothetical protein